MKYELIGSVHQFGGRITAVAVVPRYHFIRSRNFVTCAT